MWLEPPPKPTPETEQALSQLATYYRQLIAYHQQSAAIASSKLAQIEAILTANSFSLNSSWQYSPLSSPPLENSSELVAELEAETKSLPEAQLPKKEELSKVLQKILKANKGKMLRLDYLSLEVGEKLAIFPLYQPQLKIQLQQILEQGTDFGLWANVPDSPECWTYSLADFPDFTLPSTSFSKKKTSIKKTSNQKAPVKKRPYNLSRLPECDKIDEFGTLTGAIRECLSQYAPQTLDAHQVMAWMYPDGLNDKDKARAYQAVSDGLNKGCSRDHWKRVEVGRYTV
jgi:hypothetical protein